jgi:WD40 repeat protein
LAATKGGHEGQSVTSVAFSRQGDLLASGGKDQQLVLWEVQPDGDLDRLSSTIYHTRPILAIAFSQQTLFAAGGDSRVCAYGFNSRRLIGGPTCLSGRRTGAIRAVQFVDGASRLLAAGTWNPIVAWKSILWNQSNDDEISRDLEQYVCQLAGRNLRENEWEEVFSDTELGDGRHETCAQYPLP